MDTTTDFTKGKILGPLIKFAVPILLTGLLQVTYGAVDLIIVGQFCETAEISGVSTGSQFMSGIISVLYGFAVAITVLMAQNIGEKNNDGVEKSLSAGIVFFAFASIVFTGIIAGFAGAMAKLMNTPAEAYSSARTYIRICGCGSMFIIAYNLLGSIFRGVGDSKTPLMTVAIATVINIIGDLYTIGVLKMGAAGAAISTVVAQLASVLISLAIIRRRNYSFTKISRSNLRPEKEYIKKIVKIGVPLSMQDTLVTISFLVITVIVNSLGVNASAAAGVGGKICNMIMLVSTACSITLASFVAQNVGAQEHERAKKALGYLMVCAFLLSAVVAWFTFFHGDIMVRCFADDSQVISMGWDYLRAYAFDTLLTCFLFCFLGYFNGYAKTRFVMLQGLVGAFLIRIPFAYIMSRTADPNLFKITLATPASSIVQIVMCILFYIKNFRKQDETIASGE